MSSFRRTSTSLGARRDRDRVLFITAAGVALAAVVVFVMVLNLDRNTASATQANSALPPVEMESAKIRIPVPSRPVKIGEKLSDVQFTDAEFKRDQLPEGVIRNTAEVSNLYAKADLVSGLPLQRSQVSNTPVVVSLPLTAGNRAVSIEVDEISGLEGHAQPGTRVDVVLTYLQEGILVSNIIVQNARVLSYGGDTTPALPGQQRVKASRTMTLDVAVQDALKIQTARQMGRLSLILRSVDDTAASSSTDVSSTEFGPRHNRKGPKEICTKGKMKMGGKEYLIGCDGSLVLTADADSDAG